MAESTRSASEKAEVSSKGDFKEQEAGKPEGYSVKSADKEAFLVTEKFLTDALGVRY